MIVSIVQTYNQADGWRAERIHHFQYHAGDGAWVRVCQRCGATRCETLTPVDVWEGDEQSPDERAEITGQTLCQFCCLSPDVAGWPSLEPGDVRGLWAKVRTELGRALAETEGRKKSGAVQIGQVA